MFKATKEFLIGDTIIAVGQEVANPTQRMQDLGLVVEVQEVQEAPVAKVEKPKKEKKEDPKVDETEKTEILTEQSSNVTVEKTEEKTEE